MIIMIERYLVCVSTRRFEIGGDENMTFGKDQDPKEHGKKGALASNKNKKKYEKSSKTMKEKWKDEEYRKVFKKSMRKTKAWSKEHLTKMGQMSRKRENAVIENIRPDYDKIFLPQEVCDRIAIKDGKMFFIEVKGPRQQLRPKQKEFKEITKNRYIVIKSR